MRAYITRAQTRAACKDWYYYYIIAIYYYIIIIILYYIILVLLHIIIIVIIMLYIGHFKASGKDKGGPSKGGFLNNILCSWIM